ncbi:MAG TPA: magnesium transporter MgtE, partial [Bacteroidales bacterium]|nr:magnesium transporter MgtE [Bacteroidales bacterium]
MTSQITFYLSQILGKSYISESGAMLGRIIDFLVEQGPLAGKDGEPLRPRVVAIRVKKDKDTRVLDFTSFEIKKFKRKLRITCHEVNVISPDIFANPLWLRENILDKQIVDISGRKLVRVNDIRLVIIPAGTYALAVDVGLEGLLRRIGIDKPIQTMLDPFRASLPGKFILWDDIATVDFSNTSIKLSKAFSRLNT